MLFGIILACEFTFIIFGLIKLIGVAGFFFVVQNSKRQCIRALYYGDTAMSTVRRPSAHRQYIREVACQVSRVSIIW